MVAPVNKQTKKHEKVKPLIIGTLMKVRCDMNVLLYKNRNSSPVFYMHSKIVIELS